MAGVYRPRHPERTVLYRVLFHHLSLGPGRRGAGDGGDGLSVRSWCAIMGCMPTPTFMEHLTLTFVAAKPPPSHVFTEVALMEAEESGEYC